MNSSPKNLPKYSENGCFYENLNDVSPVTDLAMNLKSLKTNLTATPTRRISWSDPFKNANVIRCSGEFSPSTDSPMFQEMCTKNVKRCKKAISRKALSLDTMADKENIPPEKNGLLTKTLSSESDNVANDSQDSGYCSTSGKKFGFSSSGSTPCLRVRSSLFTSANENCDSLFAVDCETDVEPALNVESLLTKPLCNIENSSDGINAGKSSVRRCLSVEMDCSTRDSSVQMDVSQDNVQMSSTTRESISINMDSEPFPSLPFKRTDPGSILEWQNKRRKSSPTVHFLEEVEDKMDFMKQRSFSETAATIMQAVQKADLQPDLIGDCSRCYALPLVKGHHQDLKCISSETLIKVMNGEFSQNIDSYTLIDCRYPYEYEGGHIKGAQNIYTKEEIIQTFLEKVSDSNKKNIIIFHCEFSSERAPKLCRFLRNKDREMNECNYPKLHHPEMYLLDGGYKNFFARFQEYCEPQDYKPMNHKDHGSDLRLFRAKSKSWGSDSKPRLYKLKSKSDMNVI